MRYRTILTVLATIMAMATTLPAREEHEGLGLGIILGEPTGVSAKYWMDGRRAIDAAAAWSFSEQESFQFHADYLVHSSLLLRPANVRHGCLHAYLGIGGRIRLREQGSGKDGSHEHASAGVRVPFGFSYLSPESPFDIFLEVVPILDLVPDTDFSLNAAIGGRFYFR